VFRSPSPLFRLPALVFLALASPPDDYQATREEFVETINAIRKAGRVAPLRLSALLSRVAQKRADEIEAGADMHVPAAREDSRRATEAGYEPRVVSEIAVRADGDVESVVSGWREAEGATARDLVGADYRDIGVGVSFGETPLYVVLFAQSWDDFFHEKTAPFADLERMRQEMLARVNRERTSRGLAPLRRHPYLDDAAQGHADDMFARRYYSHDSLERKTAMERVTAKGYRARYVGENIARGQYSVDEVMDGWMESPTHRDHLLSPVFNDVGFGLKFGKNPGGYEILWVQNFARPRGRERL
jgi:uncharacterized protein YkwD